MAWRYGVQRPRDGDVVHADHWVQNIAEISNEFNGLLDRDNLTTSIIAPTMVKSGAFNKFYSDTFPYTTDNVNLRKATTDWQKDDPDGARIGSMSFDALHDGLVIVEWSGTYDWSVADAKNYADESAVRFRITANGLTIAESGWLFERLNANGIYLVGAAPIQAGPTTIRAEARVARIANVSAVTTGILEIFGSSSINAPGCANNTPVVKSRVLTIQYKKR